ncbi:hypothetical protein QAD02_006501 [Eretmocerus hayati]|uniref:Uncharacterized protein n=1 Tax=Eretmocerus hayati TaxID=131215 RepID=A0ACC2N134_9HYME|nr:hypothetical protein QAD02_006501 [Eretmocerus hayati]
MAKITPSDRPRHWSTQRPQGDSDDGRLYGLANAKIRPQDKYYAITQNPLLVLGKITFPRLEADFAYETFMNSGRINVTIMEVTSEVKIYVKPESQTESVEVTSKMISYGDVDITFSGSILDILMAKFEDRVREKIPETLQDIMDEITQEIEKRVNEDLPTLAQIVTAVKIVWMRWSDPEFFPCRSASSPTVFFNSRFSRVPYLIQIGFLLILVSLTLHVLDRNIEYTSRTDFLWRNKLKVEQDEVETMRGINKILLENILPAHVADHFLEARENQKHDLYHETYNSIAVMFASIPNYKEFYDETDINKQELECLRLLNEIICDFDKLLLKPKYSSIEKIKTIGSTYMLACGLSPGKEDSEGQIDMMKQQEHNVIVLVEFAISLMTLLDQINRESFQRFKLRIVLNHGPVIAGVVGAQKPQYDIWGNTVNVASRMDSCGEMGRIQVTEDTAKILQSAGYKLTCRGPTYVKGKGQLTTYYVNTAFDTKEGSH